MRKISLLIGLIVCLFGLVTLSACDNISDNEIDVSSLERVEISGHGDVGFIRTVERLTNRSTHVFRGEVLDSRFELFTVYQPRDARVELLEARGAHEDDIHGARYYEVILDPTPVVMTIYQIQVLEVFRELEVFHDEQIATGDIIEVARPGGAYGGQYFYARDAFNLESGSEYVLFLERHWELPHFFYTISGLQGAYHVPDVISEDEDLVEHDNLSLELETVSDEDFGLVFTIEDLIDIAEENGLLEYEDKPDDEPEDVGDVYGDGVDDEEENDAEIEQIEDSDE